MSPPAIDPAARLWPDAAAGREGSLPELKTWSLVVAPSDCDLLGHMNVGRYLAACGDGVFALQAALGLTADDIRSGRRLSFAVVHMESDFKAELHLGDAVHLTTGIVELGRRSASFRHRLWRTQTGQLCFEARFKSVMLDLVARRATELPDAVRQAARGYMID